MRDDPSLATRGLDAFVSYSRRDQPFVFRLKESLEQRGRKVWIDADDIPPGAPWRRELGTGIEAADTFVFVISPDSVASPECAEELRRASELGKRLVPVLFRPAAGIPEALAAVQYIYAHNGADLNRTVEQVEQAIDTDSEWVRAHTQWLARALRWDERGRDRSSLLRGGELQAAEHWLAQQSEGRKPPPTPLQTQYIVASRQAETRRLRTIVGLTLTALAVSIALGVIALLSRNEAIKQRDQARSRELAASAVNQLDVDPERSLLLALEAERVAPSGPAHDALRRALVESHVRTVMRGHTAAVGRLAVSRDGRRVMTGSRDGTARLFDAATGSPLAVLRGHRGPIEAVAVSSRALLTASDDGTARLWSVDGRPLHVLRHSAGAVLSAAFSPDGAEVVTAGADGTARLWDTASGQELVVLRGHRGKLRSAAFNRDGSLLLTGGEDGTARLWNVASRRGRVLARYGRAVNVAQFSRDGRRALTADDGGAVRLWDVTSGRLVTSLPGIAFVAALSPDGRAIVTGTTNGPATVWDAATGSRRAELEGHGGAVMDAAFSADSRLVVTAGLDATARVWDAVTGATVAVLRGHAKSVDRARFTPDGRAVITVSGDTTARGWDIGRGIVLRGRQAGRTDVQPAVNAVAGGPGGRTVLTAGNDGTARLWDARTGKEAGQRQACGLLPSATFSCLSTAVGLTQQSPIASADLSRDGRHVATGADNGTAYVYETDSGKVVAGLRGHTNRVQGIAFSQDGRHVATGSYDHTVRVWDASRGSEIALMRGMRDNVNAVAFVDDDSRVVAAGADGTVRIWETTTGRPLSTFRLSTDGIGDVAASPDGRYLAAPIDEEVRVWKAATGATVATLTDHDGLVFSVGFSPDGRELVTGGQDLTARLWEVPSGRPLGVLRGHTEYLIDTAFSLDGRQVLTASHDGTAHVFACDACGSAEQLAQRAQHRVTRALSAAERQRFL